jgi:hypothetical protein
MEVEPFAGIDVVFCMNPEFRFVETMDIEGFKQWNQRIGLFESDLIESININEWVELLNKPLRVCGMVRNNGQPGGGPFYMEYNDMLTKQIVEIL